ncbi:MAG: exodeoxyribonuclease VII small subunit [Oscillospiraceae bacterium]|nr:exodeoxyribonuclease VII small subunit [Oscillospiraceae bacterium]
MSGSKMTFEEAMDRLEQIVRLLEKGDTPLEEAMKLFEEGTALAKKCTARLDAAEKKIMKLVRSADGEVSEEEFDVDEEL